ncbi:HlyD family efflux transporter periplasmic adaptor subunit [uncultured Cyclobacterium sp.]|uniref:HlyD family secretion protein n=1 Tax=uncultured Cyclobacterium sp. TaxID=453820 RepID=UPI0030EE3134|tara:strand:+ start:17428 stop:18327 length:900 start_codon:yes stop_codon:yes gene_type:complete
MKTFKLFLTSILLLGILSCNKEEKADGYGNFEATEITVSAESAGKLLFLEIEEGQVIAEGELVGLVDTVSLYLSKQQLLALKETVFSKSGSVSSQINVLKEQLKNAVLELDRVSKMMSDGAATQQQLDKGSNQVEVLKKQIKNVQSQQLPIEKEALSFDARIAQIDQQIAQSVLKNPIYGTVLGKFAETGEVVSFGKPLYKIADLDNMLLRVYISETQLPNVTIGQEVRVKIDSNEGMKAYNGKVSWVSSTAEFTPKIIQTKEERVNLVYAVKIKVKNDGSLKIGMPAEMWIEVAETEQ